MHRTENTHLLCKGSITARLTFYQFYLFRFSCFTSAELTSGQSYKQFMLVIYESRVVIWGIFKSGTTLGRVVNYDRKLFIRLATEI